MIARPHICLRCQNRLARLSAPSKPRIASISSYTGSAGSEVVPDDPEDDEGFHAPLKRPLKLSRRPLSLSKHVSEFPLGKLYGFSGQQLRENRERLSIDVLGEKADVIVLRDSKINNYHNYRYEESAETKQEVDILARLDEERGLVGWEEVVRNINEFRPTDGRRPETREQFSELLTGLQNGFTVSQLAKYLQNYREKDLDDLSPVTSSLAVRISPWIPGISGSEAPLDSDHLRGYDLPSYTTKQRLVLRILRECWKVELPFVEEGIGQIEVEVKPQDLDLLLGGRRSALDKLHSTYIFETEERLEIFKSTDAKRSRNAIRITSTRTKSYSIVESLEEELKPIHRLELPLNSLMPQSKKEQSNFSKWANTHFDELVVKQLARLTDTKIQKTSQGSLLIASLNSNANTKFSTKSDVARRLAISSINLPDREISRVGLKDTSHTVKARFVKYPLIEGLAWRERLGQWSRWVTPISRDTGVEDKATKSSGADRITVDAQRDTSNGLETQHEVENGSRKMPATTQRAKPRVPPPAGVAIWSDEINVQSSALMGAVLYDQSQLPAKDSPKDPSFADATRSFSTSIPGISRLLASASASDKQASESIIMKFLPNPFFSPSGEQVPIGSAARSAFPPIEMRFAVDPRTRLMELDFVHAIHSTENSDLMLPDSPMDIRFQQITTSRLYYNRRRLPPWIANFLAASNLTLDYSRGGLQTPPSLMIPIASHICNKDAFGLLGSDKVLKENQNVEYLFTGLEIRKTISMGFKGWRLLYTSIEAGKAGGRRGELRLRPARIVESGDPALETAEAFQETAFQLADTSYTAVKLQKILGKLVRSVVMHRDKIGPDANRIFTCFVRRPLITMEGGPNLKPLDEEFGEEL
ncbi:hypothetical protein D0Z07_1726 [Hyphodiscus hymeniophilus]|uniref:Uncharacterized protein n=1 Tax=Hyphodiscus hymeniophilus TaxID=353542 RepID=A0A9P7AZW2_9HELO|nr:hypothetical protein D0Z07_1726 [Hyphodiscus hymeniophilus]